MPQQIVIIHGGDTFETYEEYLKFLKSYDINFERLRLGRQDWKKNLRDVLGSGYEVIAPTMPSIRNAKYLEWKIWFEKLLPYLQEEVILIGHSLGGTFLAKYLAENKFPKRLKAVFLVAPCYDGEGTDYSLADFSLPQSLAGLGEQAPKLFIYHSEDDKVVPFPNLKKFQAQLPNAVVRVFTNRGHFNQEELPELVGDVRNLM